MKNRMWQFSCYILLLLPFFAFKISALDPYTVITKTAPVMDALRGSTFEIRCDVNNRPNGISMAQRIQMRWEREGLNCSSGKTCRTTLAQDRLPNDQQKYGIKFQASDTYYLIIKNIDENDEGRYYCQLPLTLYVKVYDYVTLRVVEPPSIDPLKTSSDKFVSINDSVELTCGAYGRPKPLIKWTRAGNGKMPGGGYVKLAEKLKINRITADYRGTYICTATNDIGEDYRTIDINMNFPPQFGDNPVAVQQKIGYETRIFCHVSARPKAAVTWRVGSSTVGESNSDKYKVTNYESAFNNVISKLTIYKVSQTEINSDIVCVANNGPGSTKEKIFKVQESSSIQPIPGASSLANYMHVTFALLLSAMVTLLL